MFCLKNDLSDKNRFKIIKTCEQFGLTGCVLITNDIKLIIVEGKQKGIRFFTNLVLNRIDWKLCNETNINNLNSEYCVQVWNGPIHQRNFKQFVMKYAQSESEAKQFLQHYSCLHYYFACNVKL